MMLQGRSCTIAGDGGDTGGGEKQGENEADKGYENKLGQR